MNNDTRDILIQLKSLGKLIELKNVDTKIHYEWLLEIIKTSLEEKKENLNYELKQVEQNLELLKKIKEDKKN